MNQIKSLQDQIEQSVANELKQKLLSNHFIRENFRVIDMFNYVRKYMEENSLSTIFDCFHKSGIDASGDELFSKGNGGIPSRMREVMFERMFPEALDSKLKEITKKLCDPEKLKIPL